MSGILALQMKLILQIFFTLSVFSFLYRDNPLYRLAEHAFVGVAAGYGVVVEFHTAFGDVAESVKRIKDAGFARSIVLRDDAKTPVIYFARV